VNYTHDRNWGCRLTTDLTFRGMRTVVLENEHLRISVLADKGTDIIEFLYKPRDLDFMWRSPLGIRNPTRWVPSSARSDGAFLDHYEGGWQEILPSGGAPAEFANAEFGLHGEVSLLPWDFQVLKDDPEEVAVRFWVRTYRTPFHLEKTLRLREDLPALLIEERLTNEGVEPLPVMWGHHPGFGAPFLEESARIRIPARTLIVHNPLYHPNSRLRPGYRGKWPLAEGRDGSTIDASKVIGRHGNAVDLLYATDLEDGWAALVNERQNIGFGLAFPKDVFRTIWLWQVYGGFTGSPWYGRTYNLGLEPWTSYPSSGLNEAIDNGSARTVEAGGSVWVEIAAVVLVDVLDVRGITTKGLVRS
jgi:uncharacterized protein DUF4432